MNDEATKETAEAEKAKASPSKPTPPVYQPSEDVRRSQKLLENLEEKKQQRARLIAEIKSKEVMLEGLDKSISNLRTQIDAELKKIDPELERRVAFQKVS